MTGIFRGTGRRASVVLALGVVACGGRPLSPGDAAPVERPLPPPTRLDGVVILESWGVPAEDTVVTFPAYEPRAILLRRGPPDNSLFAELTIPAGTLLPPEGKETSTVTLRPRPGAYGLEVELEPGSQLRPGARLTFSYAVHFVMPEAARPRHATAIAFERELLVAQLGGDGMVTFLRSQRLASDHLTAMLTGPGRYIVAAPR